MFFYLSNSNKLNSKNVKNKCLIVDNDGSFDDLRSLIFLNCSQEVVPTHIIFTEGVVEPKESFKNFNFLKEQHNFKGRETKVYHGLTFGRKLDARWTNVRNRDRLLNNYFSESSKNNKVPNAALSKLDKASLASECDEIELLILGPYTSAIKYWSEIAEKVSRVVTMGGANEEFFNCWYDPKACKKFFRIVPKEKMFSINIPIKSFNDSTFSFTKEFIETFEENKKLALWQDIFWADPSGWKPEDILMWDDLTSFFLQNSQSFKKSKDYWQPIKEPIVYLKKWKEVISHCAVK